MEQSLGGIEGSAFLESDTFPKGLFNQFAMFLFIQGLFDHLLSRRYGDINKFPAQIAEDFISLRL
jgi:hypothetical protein